MVVRNREESKFRQHLLKTKGAPWLKTQYQPSMINESSTPRIRKVFHFDDDSRRRDEGSGSIERCSFLTNNRPRDVPRRNELEIASPHFGEQGT